MLNGEWGMDNDCGGTLRSVPHEDAREKLVSPSRDPTFPNNGDNDDDGILSMHFYSKCPCGAI